MATLPNIDYVSPGYAQPRVNQATMDVSSASRAAQADTAASEHLGNAFQQMVGGINNNLSQEEHTRLREEYRLQQADAKAQAAQQVEMRRLEAEMLKQQKAESDFYAARSGLEFQRLMIQQYQQMRAKATPDGQLDVDIYHASNKLIQPFIENAPDKEAAMALALSGMKVQNYYQKAGFKGQTNVNRARDVGLLEGFGSDARAAALTDPNLAPGLIQQQTHLMQTMKESGRWSDKAEAQYKANIDAINSTALGRLAADNPLAAQEAINNGVAGGTVKLYNATRKQIEHTIVGDLKETEDSLKFIHESTKLGFAPPQNTQELLNKAESIKQRYKDQPAYAAKLATLDTELQIAQQSAVWGGALTGSTPDELKKLELDIQQRAAANPGNPVAVGVFNNVKQYIKAREDKFKTHEIMDVEQADGTIAPSRYKLDLKTTSDPQILKEFIKEKNREGIQLQEKWGNTTQQEQVLPFHSLDINNYKRDIETLSPVEQLKALEWTNNLETPIRDKLLKKIGTKDMPDNPMGLAIRLSGYDPQTAQKIAMGIEALSRQGGKLSSKSKPEDVSAAIYEVFGDKYQNDPKLVKQYIGAAEAYSAHNLVTTGSVTALPDALRAVSGSTEVTQVRPLSWDKSYETVMPFVPDPKPIGPGMSKDLPQFRRMVPEEFHKITDIKDLDTLWNYGNGMPVDPITGEFPDLPNVSMRGYQWVAVSGGQYLLKKGDRVLMNNQDGSPYKFNMRQYLVENPLGAPPKGILQKVAETPGKIIDTLDSWSNSLGSPDKPSSNGAAKP